MKQLSRALTPVRASLAGCRAGGCQHFSETREGEQHTSVVCRNSPVCQGKQCQAASPGTEGGGGDGEPQLGGPQGQGSVHPHLVNSLGEEVLMGL